MTKFSANLGFLWSDRPLIDAIHASHAAGFEMVECHWPYEYDAAEVKAVFDANGLTMLGLNTVRGNLAANENGLVALPGYQDEARATIDQTRRIIEAVATSNLKLMFDCYHIQILEGDLTRRLQANIDIIRHIQFAEVPSRGRPDNGEINYQHIFKRIADMGYTAPLGAEYKPENGDTDSSLGWKNRLG